MCEVSAQLLIRPGVKVFFGKQRTPHSKPPFQDKIASTAEVMLCDHYISTGDN